MVSTHWISNIGYGCNHYYRDFLPGAEWGPGGSQGFYAAYIYDPMIPEADGISAAIEDTIEINKKIDCVICD